MRQTKKEIDSVSVARSTDFAINICKDTVTSALEYLRDDKKKERLVQGECPLCFYIHNGRIGGAAMTERPCGICGKDIMYGSTNTDGLCLKCAIDNQLCKHCGADVHLRPRRMYEKTKNI